MSTPRRLSVYRCSACGESHPKWVGRCTKCNAWDTVTETAPAPQSTVGLRSGLRAGPVSTPARRVGEIVLDPTRHTPTGIGEFDRVLGGGLVRGAVVLLAGEPGVGKSTLLLGVAHHVARHGRTVLVASGEESAEQIKLRADRVGADADRLFIAAETDLAAVLGHVDQVNPDLLIVDSIQAVASGDIDGRSGGVAQVTEVTTALTRVAKQRGMHLILVGQVTREGTIAGPRLVEHMVDVVISFEGDRHSTLRMIRGVKNRFGPADEVGCFEHTDTGIVEVPDPSGLFLGRRDEPVPGTCTTVVIEGKRPIPAEVQALVAPTSLPVPRRGSSGLDAARLAMTLAATERHGKVRLAARDVYCATVGGMRIGEPAADLAVAFAVASAAADLPIRGDAVAVGEVTLSGDVRRVSGLPRRLAEAARLGFTVALVPPGTRDEIDRNIPIAVVEIPHLRRAVQALENLGDQPAGAPASRISDDGGHPPIPSPSANRHPPTTGER